MLRNRIYLGEICNKGAVYPGDHEGIVDPELFAEVGRALESNRNDLAAGLRADHPSLLCGLVWDGEGRRMVPIHCSKRGVRYRYYTSQQDKDRLHLKLWRVPAGDLENIVLSKLAEHRGTRSGEMVTRAELRMFVQRVLLKDGRIAIGFARRDGHEHMVEVPATWIRRGNARKLVPPLRKPRGFPIQHW